MPNLLNPIPAMIAAGIVVPALLLLYFLKLRRREFDVPSTLLWKKAIQDLQVNAPFQRLRRNLLLLMQLLLLLALLLAFARPVSRVARRAGKLTVVLIDRSASMSARDPDLKGRSRLDEAKRRAKDLVSGLSTDAAATVIAFDDSAETVQPFTADVGLLKRKIDAIEPTDRRTRLKLAYQLADAQTKFDPDQLRSNIKPEVHLFSDGRALDTDDLSLVGNLTFEPIGSNQTANLAVVGLSAKRNYERPTQVQVFARLANFGPEVKRTDVQMSVDGQVRSVAAATLLPDRWTEAERQASEQAGVFARDSVEFTLDLTQSAVIMVEQMNKDGDALAADDSALVVVPPPKTLSVLLVTDGNYFLERAVGSLSLKDPATVTPAKYEAGLGTTYDLILFDRYQPKALPQVGSFIYFGTVPPGLKLSAEQRDGKMLADVGVAGVLDWQRDHPILRGVSSLSKLYVSDPLRLIVPSDAEVLIDGTTGPLVVLYRDGTRTHLVVGFDLLPSTWPLIVSFPVFMYNSVQYLAVGSEMNVRQSFEPGATLRLPRTALERAGGADLKQLRLIGPAGTTVHPVPAIGEVALGPFDRVGTYKLDPPVPSYEQFAVNLLDANESNLLPQTSAPAGIGQTLIGTGGQSRLELWWWLIAVGGLPLLLIEWWVYTRRVHL